MQMVKGAIFCIIEIHLSIHFRMLLVRQMETGVVSITKGVSNLVQESGTTGYLIIVS